MKKRPKPRERVLTTLRLNPTQRWFGYDLCRAARVRAGRLYVVLSALEAESLVESGWVEGPYPRRRWYRLTNATSVAAADAPKFSRTCPTCDATSTKYGHYACDCEGKHYPSGAWTSWAGASVAGEAQ